MTWPGSWCCLGSTQATASVSSAAVATRSTGESRMRDYMTTPRALCTGTFATFLARRHVPFIVPMAALIDRCPWLPETSLDSAGIERPYPRR